MKESPTNQPHSIEIVRNAERLILAPNGEVSRYQNPELHQMIRSDKFLSWFGDWTNSELDNTVSKAVFDDTHEPILFTHRTKETYVSPTHPSVNYDRTFGGEYGLPKKAVYFTTADLPEYGKNVYYCFLNIRNPAVDWSEVDKNADGCIIKFTGNKNGYHAAVFSDEQIKLLD